MQAFQHSQVSPHPGYVSTVAPAPPTVQPQPAFVTQTVISSPASNSGGMKSSIPDLPFALALIYGILNFFFPGVGTMLAGVSVLFCGSVRQSGEEKVGVFCTNFWVGFLQALLAPFFVGWVWSVIWGIAIISASGSTETQNQGQTVVVSQQQALPQPQIVYPQPVPPPQPTVPAPAPIAVPPAPHPNQAW